MSGMTWLAAADKAARARNPRQGAKLANNTYVREVDGNAYAIRVHSTDVVTIHPDNTYTIRTGGWHSQLTSGRIRAYSPVSVGMHKGQYMLWVHAKYEYRHPDGRVSDTYVSGFDHHVTRDGYRVPFVEGMRVNSDGEPVDDADGFSVAKIVKTKGA